MLLYDPTGVQQSKQFRGPQKRQWNRPTKDVRQKKEARLMEAKISPNGPNDSWGMRWPHKHRSSERGLDLRILVSQIKRTI
jgi:hypothetical protein